MGGGLAWMEVSPPPFQASFPPPSWAPPFPMGGLPAHYRKAVLRAGLSECVWSPPGKMERRSVLPCGLPPRAVPLLLASADAGKSRVPSEGVAPSAKARWENLGRVLGGVGAGSWSGLRGPPGGHTYGLPPRGLLAPSVDGQLRDTQQPTPTKGPRRVASPGHPSRTCLASALLCSKIINV